MSGWEDLPEADLCSECGGQLTSRDDLRRFRFCPGCATPATPYERLRTLHRENRRLQAEAAAATRAAREAESRLLNTPELADFSRGVVLEALHQRQRWGAEHDAGKTPTDWFWLVGYLAGKCLQSAITGNVEKALHHTISTGAALANWHAALLGKTDMRPGLSGERQSEIDGPVQAGAR